MSGTVVALYLRVSTEEQRLRESINNQRHLATTYCRLNNLVIVDEYADDGVSGASPLAQRPQGRRLLDDAATGRFEAVIVSRVDRFSRSTLDLLRTIECLDQVNVALRSASEPFETSSSSGRFLLAMLGSVAQLERDVLRERLTLGYQRAVREGRWIGGNPPLGYRLSRGRKLEIAPAEADVVRRIFALYATGGHSVLTIANVLNLDGVPTARAMRVGFGGYIALHWSGKLIAQVLKNRLYTGRQILPSSGIERNAPAIIDDTTFGAAAAVALGRYRQPRQPPEPPLLQGLARCAHCRRVLRGLVGESYRCPGMVASIASHSARCVARQIFAPLLDGLVWRAILEALRDPATTLDSSATQPLLRSGRLAVELYLHQVAESASIDAAPPDRALIEQVVDWIEVGTVSDWTKRAARQVSVTWRSVARECRVNSRVTARLELTALSMTQTWTIRTTAQAARMFGVSSHRVLGWARRGEVDALRFGHCIYVLGEERRRRRCGECGGTLDDRPENARFCLVCAPERVRSLRRHQPSRRHPARRGSDH